MPYAKNTIKVQVQKRSGFDKSHRNTGTGFVGTLIPLLCDELIPNSRVSLKIPINVQLPPLASETYMNMRYEIQAFFVPSRLLCGSFESFFCDSPRLSLSKPGGNPSDLPEFKDVSGRVPYFEVRGDDLFSNRFGPGTLADYLGIRTNGVLGDNPVKLNPLPFAAYHLVWQEWYRNPRVQRPCFAPFVQGPTASNRWTTWVCSMPYEFYHDAVLATSAQGPISSNLSLNVDGQLADGTSIWDLRQRNFDQDYFTGARVSAQQGSPVSVTFDTSGASGEMTIAALRAANSLQQFRERNNIPSQRLVDQVRARYGANLSDGIAQRPICIGSSSFEVYSRGVDQTAPYPGGTSSKNPFNGVAAQYGRAVANGSEFVIEDFTANEPGYLLVIGSLVPEVSYSYGIDPQFLRYTEEGSIVQMACALLQNQGDQPIYTDELTPSISETRTPFGYTDRFADFMFKPNTVHAKMREGQNLSSFVLQRAFTANVQLSSAFLEIPKEYLDNVLVVASATSGLSYWYDSILQYHVSMPLAEFSLPSLQDPAYEHGETISLRRNGQIF